MTCSCVTRERSFRFTITYRNLGNFRGFYSRNGSVSQKVDSGWAHHWPCLGQNNPLRVNFQNSSVLLRFNTGQRWTFPPEFHADLSHYEEMRIHCNRCKNSHSSHHHFGPIWPTAPTFYRWGLPELFAILFQAGKLNLSVQLCFIRRQKVLNCCWFWANTYAWQHRPTIKYFSPICKVTASKFTAKLLLLCHSENYIKLNFVVISHKIFLARLFCAPLPATAAPLLRHWTGCEWVNVFS